MEPDRNEKSIIPLVLFPSDIPVNLMKYSVIAAVYGGKWLYVRHKKRDTYEIPGGHIDPGEEPLDAARRELYEESGASEFSIWPVCCYDVVWGTEDSYGMLFFAHITRFDDMPDFEMNDKLLSDTPPVAMTYPAIQPFLYKKVKEWLDERITQIYFIRHAESDYRIKDDAARPLTENGRTAAAGLVGSLGGIVFDGIYSSPYRRAVQTVEPLAEKLGMEIMQVDDFRERRIDSEWIEDFNSFCRRQWLDFSYKLTDGECLSEVQSRNIAALRLLLPHIKGKTVAIGTHGTALSTILNYYNPSFGYEDFERIKPRMPYVVRLDFLEECCVGVEEINAYDF